MKAQFYSKYTTLPVIQALALAIKIKLKDTHCCGILKILNNQDMISGMGALNTNVTREDNTMLEL